SGVAPVGASIGGQPGATIGLRGTVLVGAAGVRLALLWVALSPGRTLRSPSADPDGPRPSPSAIGQPRTDRDERPQMPHG
ncbi:MAG: hypothetical protein ACRDJN_23625, partial [Chloroflexota bacterium]